MSKYFIVVLLDCRFFLVYLDNRWEYKLKYFGVIKIVIKLLVLYKNIFFRVVVNMNNRNFVIVIFVYLMYFMDRGIYKVEYNKIRN